MSTVQTAIRRPPLSPATLPTSSSSSSSTRKGRSRSEGTDLLSSRTASSSSSSSSSSFPIAPHYGHEIEEGNIEHKWRLTNTSAERLTHLTTQLHWRLNESSQGEALYLLGVRDDGFPEGISEEDFRESLQTLRRMAKGVNACIVDVEISRGAGGGGGEGGMGGGAAADAAGTGGMKKVAEVRLKREVVEGVGLHSGHEHVRVAVLGGVEGGKSTLVGVLTKGRLDNGRGLARMQVFRHNHEVENGKTSSVSQHILGFRADGCVANYRLDDAAAPAAAAAAAGGDGDGVPTLPLLVMDNSKSSKANGRSRSISTGSCIKNNHKGTPSFPPSFSSTSSSTTPQPLSAQEIQQTSSKVISFIDLAGDEKYLKTTLAGMVGLSPDHAMITLPANAAATLAAAAVAADAGKDEGGVGLKEHNEECAVTTPPATAASDVIEGGREGGRKEEEDDVVGGFPSSDVSEEDDDSSSSSGSSEGASLKARKRSLPPAPTTTSTTSTTTITSSSCSSSSGSPLEHLDIALALGVPLFVVLTKADTATEGQVAATVAMVRSAVHAHHHRHRPAFSPSFSYFSKDTSNNNSNNQNKKEERDQEFGCLYVRSEEDLERAVEAYIPHPAPTAAAASPPRTATSITTHSTHSLPPLLPIFLLSSVTGQGLPLLRRFLHFLPRSLLWAQARRDLITEIHIDRSLEVEGVGCVLNGAIYRGRVKVGDRLLLGPEKRTGRGREGGKGGGFEMVVVKSMHLYRVPVREAGAGQCVSLSFERVERKEDEEEDDDEEVISAAIEEARRRILNRSNSSSIYEHDDDDDELVPLSASSKSIKSYKGCVLVSPSANPIASFEFTAELLVLNDAHGPLSCNQEPSVHIYTTRQTAKLMSMDDDKVEEEEGRRIRRTVACKGETVRARFRFLFHAEYVREGMRVVVRSGRTIAVGRVVV